MSTFGAPKPSAGPQWIDLILGQVEPDEQAQLRRQIAGDPLQALEMADTVHLIERLREAETPLGPLFACRMDGVVREARRRLWRQRLPSPWLQIGLFAAAAAAVLLALVLFDPAAWLRGDAAVPAAHCPAPPVPPAPEPAAPPAPLPQREEPLERLSRLLEDRPEQPLLRASERVSEAARRDALRSWLEPRNLLAVQRLDYQLRASAAHRRAALHHRGWLPEIDDRVQQIAADLVLGLPFRLLDSDTRPIEVAFLVRALLASGTATPGGAHEQACDEAASWLLRRLPQLHDGDLAVALLALAERAASTLRSADEVYAGIARLLDETFADAAWSRRRPELLSVRTDVVCLAECGRLMAMAPGFGIDPDRALALRSLVEAHLEERRLQVPDDPALLAAMAYGFGDLSEDLDEIERKLRAWRPAELVGNYVTLMQLAWSREPGVRGWARFQLSMRRLATQPTPDAFLERAALLLCLATNYAAPGVSDLASIASLSD